MVISSHDAAFVREGVQRELTVVVADTALSHAAYPMQITSLKGTVVEKEIIENLPNGASMLVM
jgi:hypothetical protein